MVDTRVGSFTGVGGVGAELPVILDASGEESADQIGEALRRLECEHDNLLLLPETSIDKICLVAEKLDVAI
ncbi:hypothetical protein LCGC14_1979760, partial [marine sediment metagenome]